ncbi:MAG: GGDEF domain-containing response regulator [Planctomycetota bacterium]
MSASSAAQNPTGDDGRGAAHADGPTRVLLLNHRREPLQPIVQALRRAGHRATEARSLGESQRALDEAQPHVLILNPVVVKSGGVELSLAEQQQSVRQPVPVLLLVDDLFALEATQDLKVPIRDFVLKPASPDEVVLRVEAVLRTRAELQSLISRTRELEDQAATDQKTGLFTDRYFRQILHVEFKRALRHSTPLSMLWIDIDDFKSINDSTNYEFGDEVLRYVATTLRNGIRETDYAARFGGDEFTLLLPHTTPAEAVQTAIRIRRKVASQIVQAHGFSRTVTLSVGIDTYTGRAESSPDELRARANKALHVAKRNGKDQVWLYDQEGSGFGSETGRRKGESRPSSDDAEAEAAE